MFSNREKDSDRWIDGKKWINDRAFTVKFQLNSFSLSLSIYVSKNGEVSNILSNVVCQCVTYRFEQF